MTFNGITSAFLGGLTGSQNIVMTNLAGAAVNLPIGGNNTSQTYSGSLIDNGLNATLTKGGAGTATLTGTNLYSGETFITGGTLKIGDPGLWGTNGIYIGPVS